MAEKRIQAAPKLVRRALFASAAWILWSASYLLIRTIIERTDDFGPGDALGVLAVGFGLILAAWLLSLLVSIIQLLRTRPVGDRKARAEPPAIWELLINYSFSPYLVLLVVSEGVDVRVLLGYAFPILVPQTILLLTTLRRRS